MTGLGPPYASNADQFGWSSGSSTFTSTASFPHRDVSPVFNRAPKVPSSFPSSSNNSLDQLQQSRVSDLTERSQDFIKFPGRIGAGLPSASSSNNSGGLINQFNQLAVASKMSGLINASGAIPQKRALDQEFPSLGKSSPVTPVIQQPVISNQGVPTGSRPNFLSAANKSVQLGNEEFTIQQEDFPALPGTTSIASTSNSADVVVDNNADPILGAPQGTNTVRALPGGVVTGVPASMVRDQFGMIGLLTLIRAGEDNPNFSVIAPGIDLSSLGLPLNNNGEIYSCLGSPWSEPCLARPQYIDYPVPPEYLVGAYIKEKLPAPPLEHLQVETLFWLFYNCTCDSLQLSAAKELHRRDWRWIKSEKLWVTRSGHGHEKMPQGTAERGVYYYWDIKSWSRQQRQFTIYYEHIDNTPNSYPDPTPNAATSTTAGVNLSSTSTTNNSGGGA